MHEENSGLIDIIEPAAPAIAAGGGWLWVAALMVVLLLLAIALFALWKYKLPAYRALKQLRQLKQQWLAAELTPHEAILMLALELRHGMAVKRLHADKMPPQIKAQEHARWAEFMQQLDALLYQHGGEPDKDKLQALFEQAEYWLRRYSRRSPFKKLGT